MFPTRATSAPTIRAFTLIELMVVVLIIAVVAALAIPRLFGGEQRALRLASERIADFLLMYAQRESMAQQPIGLVWNAEDYAMELWVLDREGEGATSHGSWRMDTMVEPTVIPDDVSLDLVRVDGRAVAENAWPLITLPGHDRYTLEFFLSGGGESAQVVLYPHALSPIIVDNINDSRALERQPIDLDATGRAREPW